MKKAGFTLIEILVVVLIIGVLGAIALPQYQRAVLKSRFAALMPIAKSMADSNEAFYLEHGEYADNAEDLPIQGRRNYSDGTELEFGTLTGYSYVLATRDNNFPNNYVVYQKHSEQFPGEIHCEAAEGNNMAQDVCKSFGPTQELGETLTSGYLTYVLFGTGNGVAPTGDEGGAESPAEPGFVCPDGATCEGEEITACPNGQTLNNGSCEECATAFPGASACSATSYAATACGTGYNLTDGVCVEIPTCGGLPQPSMQAKGCGKNYTSGNQTRSATCVNNTWIFDGDWDTTACEADPTLLAKLQNVVQARCPANGQYICTIMDGRVSLCNKTKATVTADGKCLAGSEVYGYETVYDADNVLQYISWCNQASSGHCYDGGTDFFADGTEVGQQHRRCLPNVALIGPVCEDGQYNTSSKTYNRDYMYGGVGYIECTTFGPQGECNPN